MDLAPFLVSFSFVFLAELGDKTQLAVVTLCSRHRWRAVFCGAMLAFMLIDGISVLIGKAISEIMPIFWIQVSGGLLFIAFGIYILLQGKIENEMFIFREDHKAFISCFIFVSLAELGDKTQLAIIVLAAQYSQTLTVFAGMLFAFLAITAIGVIVGKSFIRIVPRDWLKFFTAALFIIFGIFFIIRGIVT